MVASTGTSLRTISSPSAAVRPRSTSSGGAMPRESERSSSTVSRAWSSAASMVSEARSGSSVELATSPAEVHGEPHQPLLRPVVDVALEPAQRGRLGLASGVAAALDPATSCWSSARLLSITCARLPCRAAANRTTSGRVSSATAPITRLSTISGCRPSPKPSSSASVVFSSGS